VTALAAGHRPCSFCRRREATEFLDRAGMLGRADDFDAMAHAERVGPAGKRTFTMDLAGLPDGTIFEEEGSAYAVRGPALLPWQPDGYGARLERRWTGEVKVLTPRSFVRVLASGYRPAWHASAGGN
jgi:hypothetical protein